LKTANYKEIDKVPFIFLTTMPLLAVLFVPLYLYFFDLSWSIVVMTVALFFISTMSITAGYHRLFSHKAYSANKVYQALMLFFGAGTFQNSCFKWSWDHRKHHKNVDTDKDPYDAKKGAFHSHLGWMMFKGHTEDSVVPLGDLEKNKLVMFQDKYYLLIAILSGAGVPTLIGHILGDPLGGFIFGFIVRTTLVHHVTFFVNSLAHIVGTQPFSDKHTARDSLFVAVLTNGEGYHNFHHTFEADYRNGIRWYNWDPTKWMIKGLSWFGVTHNLKQVSEYRILQAKMQMQEKQLQTQGVDTDRLQSIKSKMDEAQKHWARMAREYNLKKQELQAEYKLKKKEWAQNYQSKKQDFTQSMAEKRDGFSQGYAEMKEDWVEQKNRKMAQLKLEARLAKIEYRKSLEQWKACVSELSKTAPQMA
tara:strand:- start:19962 stop:21215 length:1254 start_codon:yes stop_codon:yes gene_type:complete